MNDDAATIFDSFLYVHVPTFRDRYDLFNLTQGMIMIVVVVVVNLFVFWLPNFWYLLHGSPSPYGGFSSKTS